MQCPGGRGQLLTPGGGARTESAMSEARLELPLPLSAQQAEIFQLSENIVEDFKSKPSQSVLCSKPIKEMPSPDPVPILLILFSGHGPSEKPECLYMATTQF